MAVNFYGVPILTRQTLAPLKNIGLTLEQVAQHFNLTQQDLLYRFPTLEVFNWVGPNGVAVRVHGTPGRPLLIHTNIRGGEGRDFEFVNDMPFLVVLDQIEAANGIVRGQYDMTYDTKDLPEIIVRTPRDWHAACDYHRGLGINVMTFDITRLLPINHRVLIPAEQDGAGF